MSRFHWISMTAAIAYTAACAVMPAAITRATRITCFDVVPMPLKDAVQSAEIQSGGKAVDATFRLSNEMACMEGGASHYDVTVIAGSTLTLVQVNADSRQVQAGRRTESIVATNSFRSHATIADRTRLSLSDAIAIAESHGGKAREAHAEISGGKVGYAIRLADRGSVRTTWVDGS